MMNVTESGPNDAWGAQSAQPVMRAKAVACRRKCAGTPERCADVNARVNAPRCRQVASWTCGA